MMTRIVVITGKSLSKLSLVHRIREKHEAAADGEARDQEHEGAQNRPADVNEVDAAGLRQAQRNGDDHPADRILADRRGDDDLPEVAAGESHFPHHRGHDLDRGDRECGAQEQ
jgi:hypothetical protein